jgi:toxin-antitoxin system PIN domain toxin
MTFLLDVSVLLILHDTRHPHYKTVSQWFARPSSMPFATCPITQSGLVRLLTSGVPGLAPIRMQEARDALQRLVQLPGHVYWPDAPDWLKATESLLPRMQGHRQTTDAYLLGLAIHNKGKLATLDSGICHLAGTKFSHLVELIS